MRVTLTVPGAGEVPALTGLATLAQLAFDGGDLAGLWETLVERATSAQGDPGALMDLSMILQLTGSRQQGLDLQAQALSQGRLYRRTHGAGDGPRILALVVAGDFMANTPLDFMLAGSDATVFHLYVDETFTPLALPDHDLAFVAIGESEPNDPVLARLPALLADWPRPVVNGDAAAIIALSRDGVSAAFADAEHILAPAAARAPRAVLQRTAADGDALERVLPGDAFPIIVRPIGSHAGIGLSRIDGPGDLTAYLGEREETDFYVSPFIDYRSSDGQFRKYRIAFIGGRPFLSHLAISSHWMVHYLNAGMDEDAAKRAEEADCMARFDEGFAVRQGAALAELTRRIGLDYFAIDCAEAPDGRLLLFEADVAMIVHAMDSPVLYPYKAPQMRKVFAAFQAMLSAAAGR